jgi:hypothetical protein
MANVKVIFYDSKEDEVELQCFATLTNNIFLSIEDTSCDHDYNIQSIRLDRSTAIRLVRELKKQIGFLESEVNNG